jgi:hypothetical protein
MLANTHCGPGASESRDVKQKSVSLAMQGAVFPFETDESEAVTSTIPEKCGRMTHDRGVFVRSGSKKHH